MIQTPSRVNRWRRPAALAAAASMLLPVLALPANAQLFHRNPATPGAPKKGMSTGKKVALVAGAALLYYLYRRHVAAQQAAQAAHPAQPTMGTAPTTSASNSAHPQLYRSKNGGIYYRDAQGKPIWLTVPSKPVAVSTADLQKYAPDYQQYQGPAPTAPSGYRTQSFSSFDPSSTGPTSGGAVGPAGATR